MPCNKLSRFTIPALILAAGAALPAAAQTALTTAFTYQGELSSGGTPAAGTFDVRFRLYDAATGGTQVGNTLCADNLTVSNGRFSVPLDFGAAFTGETRFLEIDVRADTGQDCSSASGYTLLSPRQELTAAPNSTFAVWAGNAATLGGQPPSFYTSAANLTGTIPDGRLSVNIPTLGGNQTFSGLLNFTNPGSAFTGAFSGSFSGSGAGLTALNAANILSGTLADARLSSNIPTLNGNQTFSGLLNFTNPASTFNGIFAGSGAGLTGLNATNIAAGTIANARTTGATANTFNTLVLRNSIGDFSAGTITANLVGNATTATTATTALTATTATNATQLNGQPAAFYRDASNLNAGTIADARLSSNVPRVSSANQFFAANQFLADVLVSSASLVPMHVRGGTVNGTWSVIGNDTVAGGRYWQLITTGSGNGNGKFLIATGTTASGASVIPMTFDPNGSVGLGTTSPSARLHLAGNMKIDGANTLEFGAGVAGKEPSAGKIGYQSFSDSLDIVGAGTNGNQGGDRKVKIWAEGGTTFTGRVSATTIEIRGGADITEGFDSQAQNVEPGTLMVIDPEHPGQLMPSTAAYDSKVAGIVSGAGGVSPGIKMGQDGVMDGKHAVAMTGRVYVKCTSAGGTIKPGDLLTTSDIAGHAMKAGDRTRAPGATIGKAMSSLDEGTGLVLVLVNLQ